MIGHGPNLRVVSDFAELPLVRVRGEYDVSVAPYLHQEHTIEEAERYAAALIAGARVARRARNHRPESSR